MDETAQNHRITRRGILHAGSAALAGVSALAVASAQDTRGTSRKSSENQQVPRSPDHRLKKETDPGPKNPVLAQENPNSVGSGDGQRNGTSV